MKLKKDPTVQEALEFLNNRKDVVKYLETHGFTDDIPESDNRLQDCPVARWLQKVTGNTGIRVGWNDVFVPREEYVPIPVNVFNAIDHFDSTRVEDNKNAIQD